MTDEEYAAAIRALQARNYRSSPPFFQDPVLRDLGRYPPSAAELAEQAEQFLAMRLPAELALRELWAVERVELDQLLPGHLSTLEAEVVAVEAQHQQTEAQEVLEQTMEAEEEVVAVALLDLLPVQAEREPMELLWW